MAVIEREGKYLAVAGFAPKTLLVGDEPLPIAEIGATMTAPTARRQGAFSALVRFLVDLAQDRGIEAMYGTPNTESGVPYVKKLHWTPLWPWHRWLRPATGPASWPFRVVGKARHLRAQPRTEAAGVVVERSDDWLTIGGVQAAIRGSDGPIQLRRDADYVQWRYGGPEYETYVLRSTESGAVLGWGAQGRTVRLGRPAVSICDLIVAPDVSGASLLARLARAEHGQPLLAFAMSSPARSISTELARAGYVARPSKFALIALDVQGKNRERDLFGDLDFRAGDSDTV